MKRSISKLLDSVSNYLAHRKGLLPILGILLIIVNYLLGFSPVESWVKDTDLLLHLGVIVSILGIMVSWAL